MHNLAAAREACFAVGISEDEFYSAISSFEGTSKRLQKIKENENGVVYLDFAHAPSKVRATVENVKEAFGDKKIKVYSNSGVLFSVIKRMKINKPVFLLMSSGDFDGINFYSLAEELLSDR